MFAERAKRRKPLSVAISTEKRAREGDATRPCNDTLAAAGEGSPLQQCGPGHIYLTMSMNDALAALADLAAFRAQMARYRSPVRATPVRSATPESIRQALADIRARRAERGMPEPAVARHVAHTPKPKTGFFY